MPGLFPRPILSSLLLGAAGVVVGAAVACTSTTTDGLPPTTGILIRAETLTSGKGCGTAPSQIYKYAAVVYGYDGTGDPAQPTSYNALITSNVFDCYTDGAFISLPSTHGSSTFRLEVFAYDKTAYDQKAAANALDLAAKATPDRDKLLGSAPTWTTECSATQLENVQALASCKPLVGGIGGFVDGGTAPTTITLDTSSITLSDGRKAACGAAAGDGGLDGGGEAGAGDAGDAGEAGTPPAFYYAQLRIRTRAGAQILADVTAPCPATYSVDVPALPASYTLDVGLLDSAGNLVEADALVECTADSFTGGSSSAVCH